MENVIDIRIALEHLGTAWRFGGSVSDGTKKAWEAVTWEDERERPTWAELCVAHIAAVSACLHARLRTERDARLAATDKYLLSDYPVGTEELGIIRAYRQALRDLPDQPGAPWDGGGEQTPWPEQPTV